MLYGHYMLFNMFDGITESMITQNTVNVAKKLFVFYPAAQDKQVNNLVRSFSNLVKHVVWDVGCYRII